MQDLWIFMENKTGKPIDYLIASTFRYKHAACKSKILPFASSFGLRPWIKHISVFMHSIPETKPTDTWYA